MPTTTPAESDNEGLMMNFTYTITDGKGGADLATMTIMMTCVNNEPDAEDNDSKMATPNDPVLDNVIGPNGE